MEVRNKGNNIQALFDDDHEEGNDSKRYKIDNNFNVEKMPLDSMVIVQGKRRYGKTTWIRWVLSQMAWYFPSGGYVFTGTKHNYFWQQHFPETRIYEGIDEEVIESILQEQLEKHEAILTGMETDSPWIVLVFDDVIAAKGIKYMDILKKIAFSGRHFFIMVFFAVQDCKGLGTDVRTNADIVAMTYQASERAYETITNEFADFFDDRHIFRKIVQNNTDDFQLVIVDQSKPLTNVNSLDDVLFVSKANPKPAPFKIGSDKFWVTSGCSWEVQMLKAANIPSHDTEDWEDAIEDQWLGQNDEDKIENKPIEPLETNMVDLASPEERENYRNQYLKKVGLDKGSVMEQVQKRIPQMFRFVPPEIVQNRIK